MSQKIYQVAFNQTDGQMRFTVRLVDGKTLIDLPGQVESLVMREGEQIEFSLTGTGQLTFLDVNARTIPVEGEGIVG